MQNLVFNYRYYIAFVFILLIYFLNMFLDVMEIDAAQYASISREMSVNKSFLQVYDRGKDYLDKPPLLFWLSSLSFLLFGVYNFTYKLPSVLVLLLGIYSTYRFTLLWYDKQRAILSALILASSQALFLITNDVRTDGNLLGMVIFSMWQLSAFIKFGSSKNLFLGAVGVGAAMLAKGPIGMAVPALAIGADLLYKQQWKNIFNWNWLLFLLIVALVLLPMSIGLYLQFDLHPEKTVYDLQGPSGLKFFFWTQSFGRLTGEIYWNNGAPFHFFLHTILWDFQPWILLFIPALIMKIKGVYSERFKADTNKEYMSLFGFVLIFLALSASQYKLPHYIFVIFPFAAVITADFLCSLKLNWLNRIKKFQFAFMHLFILAVIIGYMLFFLPQNYVLIFFITLLLVAAWFVYLQKIFTPVDKLILSTILISVAFNLCLSAHIYPQLMHYQTQAYAGKFAYQKKIPENMFFTYRTRAHALDFYAQRAVAEINPDSLKNCKKGTIIYTHHDGLQDIMQKDSTFKIIEELKHYHITSLTLPFLMQKTRDENTEKRYLLKKY